MVSANQTWINIQAGGDFPDYRTEEEKKQEIEIERKNLLARYENIKQLFPKE